MQTIHRFYKKQSFPIPLKMAWDFFSNPNNLSEITPKNLGFKVISESPEKIYPGLMLRYSVSPILSIPTLWVTEITHVNEQKYFVDEQRMGPYKIWHHEHHFFKRDENSVEMEDIIHYALPFGLIGDFFAGKIVKRQIDEIFSYRTQVLEKRFGKV